MRTQFTPRYNRPTNDDATAYRLIAQMGGGETGAAKLKTWAAQKKTGGDFASTARMNRYIEVADQLSVEAARTRATTEAETQTKAAMPRAEAWVDRELPPAMLPATVRTEVVRAAAQALVPQPNGAADVFFDRLQSIATRHAQGEGAAQAAARLTSHVIEQRRAEGSLPADSVHVRGVKDISLPPPDPAKDYGHAQLYIGALVRAHGGEAVSRAVSREKVQDPARAAILQRALWAGYGVNGSGLQPMRGPTQEGGPLARSGDASAGYDWVWTALYRAEDAKRIIADFTLGMGNSVYFRRASIVKDAGQWLVDPKDRYVVISFSSAKSCE